MQARLATLTLALACTPVHADATKIVGGSASTRHPAVVAVFPEDFAFACTGVLVAQRWVMTTANCGAQAKWVYFGNDYNGSPPGSAFHEVVEQAVHPDADGIDFAVALVRLGSAPPASPLMVETRAITAGDVGLRGTMVGFGANAAAGTGSGIKREAAAIVTAVDPNHLIAEKSSPNACFGDSGGPLLAGGRVVGLISFTDGSCGEFTGFQRMDTVMDFLTAVAEVCTPQAPCVRIFADRFGDG